MFWVNTLMGSAFQFEVRRTPPVFRSSRRKARKSLSHFPLRYCPRYFRRSGVTKFDLVWSLVWRTLNF